MEDRYQKLVSEAECSWDYIDRLRMALKQAEDVLKYAEGERDVVTKRMIELETENAAAVAEQETLQKELHEAKSEIDAAVRDRETLQKELTAYKNTGLEPEDIKVLTVIHGLSAQEISRICKLYQVEKDGRLAEIPCKVGDTVYWLHNGFITECRVHRIQMNRTGLFICLKSKVSHGAFRVDICLGKTVFMTREEAEAELAGKGGAK